MDTNTNEDKEFVKDDKKLFEHLVARIDEITRVLNDDEEFCTKDIDATITRVNTIEEKFQKKAKEFKDKLEQIRLENQTISKQNKNQFDNEIQEINQLFEDGKHQEAWMKFKNYEKIFQQRSIVIQHIPKFHMDETDIEQFFSLDYKSTKPSQIQSTNVILSTITTNEDDQEDLIDDTQMTEKRKIRNKKVFETVHIDKNSEELTIEKSEENVDHSLFGIRSRRQNNQQTTTNGTITNDSKSPTTATVPPRAPFPFSTRLAANSNSTNLRFSGRKISPGQNPPVIPEQRTSTPNSIPAIPQSQINNLILNPVLDYRHEKNIFLLMTCNPRYIVLFKSPRNRLDSWTLGAIERGTQISHNLEWHDGLIISMGYTGNNIYMFTEREFSIYSLSSHRKLDTRILPRGNDDGFEINNSSSNEYQRGIGTVYNKYMFHIYSNRSLHWTLSKTFLEKLIHENDYDLTRIFPNVLRFIHLCINKNTFNFLVQMNDLSYAVVFCPANSSMSPILLSNTNQSMPPIILSGAKQPLTIYSAYIHSFKCEVFFINDPSIDILHILTIEKYIQSYPIQAHAICYVPDKHELMIVGNNSICSINLNEQNYFS